MVFSNVPFENFKVEQRVSNLQYLIYSKVNGR